jgi:alkanesulfonate monooxygenase SsuD/methylene tetrahydromethanopterin reductase-like flavin-dependent oxidoreductase (luciferase family)
LTLPLGQPHNVGRITVVASPKGPWSEMTASPLPLDARPSIGITISSSPSAGADPVAEARHAEALGFDVVSVHRDVLSGPPPSLETWTLLTWVAAYTTTVKLAPNVLALPNRHPAVLAKMAETLDRLSGDRLILALGGGAPVNHPAFGAFGLAQRTPHQTVAATEEAIDIIHGLWRQPSFSYTGEHFTTSGADLQPRPARPVPIWLGAFGPRMLDLAGRKADGWLPSLFLLPPEQAYRSLDQIRQAASRAGRDPDQLTYGYNVDVLVKEGAAATKGQVAGGPEEVAERLAEFLREGFSFLNLSLSPAADGIQQRERLAREVLPILRAQTQSTTGRR